MKKSLKLSLVVLLGSLLCGCQYSDMRAAHEQCSRYTPPADKYWRLTESQIEDLEKNLDQLTSLETNLCCNRGKIEGSPRDYYFRYAGIVFAGRKYIYVDAHPSPPTPYMAVCDGGKSHWGVLYDPETKSFSHLAFNGEA